MVIDDYGEYANHVVSMKSGLEDRNNAGNPKWWFMPALLSQ